MEASIKIGFKDNAEVKDIDIYILTLWILLKQEELMQIWSRDHFLLLVTGQDSFRLIQILSLKVYAKTSCIFNANGITTSLWQILLKALNSSGLELTSQLTPDSTNMYITYFHP